jgi:two-component system, LytTR family, sensor kinase
VRARKPFALAGAIACCVILLASFEAAQNAIRAYALGHRFDLTRGIAESVGAWTVTGALVPLVLLMARRYRIARGQLGNVAIHGVAAAFFAFVAVTLIAALIRMRTPSLSYAFLFVKVATFYWLYYFVVYWAIAGGAHAVHYYREAQARQLAFTRERLELLRGKLNPHFLFNSLNAISTMALQRDHAGVERSIGLIGEILRTTLDDTMPQEIPLARELALAEKYLALESVRFGDRLRIERSVEPATLDTLVPSMLLQPLLENAVIHGVGSKPGAGWVRIESVLENGHVRIAVSDSGSGFGAKPGNGIGLTNTRERLQTLYGGAQRLELGSVADGGAEVRIYIPARSASG